MTYYHSGLELASDELVFAFTTVLILLLVGNWKVKQRYHHSSPYIRQCCCFGAPLESITYKTQEATNVITKFNSLISSIN